MKSEENFEVVAHPSLPMLSLKGNVTSEASTKIKEAYKSMLARGEYAVVVFDFSDVRYINSEGVAVFFSIIRDSGEGSSKIAFVSLSPSLQSIFGVVGLTDYVHIARDAAAWFSTQNSL